MFLIGFKEKLCTIKKQSIGETHPILNRHKLVNLTIN